MKICIYHPNMHLFGGGETVALTIASELAKNNDVTIFITKKVDKKHLETFFGLNLKNVKLEQVGNFIYKIPSFDSFKQSIHLRYCFPKFNKYDLIIDTCSNGLFYNKIKPKTICYVHFPNYTKPKKGLKSLLNFILIKKEDMFQYDEIICNSKFTESFVKKITDKKTEIIYPPVKTDKIKSRKKQNIIVTVGRYSPEKKHEVMIKAFKDIESELKGYEFHIIGSYSYENKQYFDSLNNLAGKSRVIFHKNMNHDEVLRFLEKSKIYWHSRGYGETNPSEYENFGITTVEAIAAGCIPIVINLGAQPEIVQNGKNGFVWNTIEELKKLTIIKKTQNKNLNSNTNKYSYKLFIKKLNKKIR